MVQNGNVNERVKEVTELVAHNRFLAKVYLWMTIALSISGVVAFAASRNLAIVNLLFGHNGIGFIVLCVVEIILVFNLSHRIRKISPVAATIGFLIYSVVNGLTISSIFLVYELSSIVSVFFISAGMFLAMTFLAAFAKSSLRSFGRYFSMGIIGIIIASLVNFFLRSSVVDTIISIVSVVIFAGLTAYDAQKLLKASEKAERQEEDVFEKAAVIGALELYLDFINIFLALIRLFGRRK